MTDFAQWDAAIVVEGPRVYRGTVTKIARVYLTVTACGTGRVFEFDKATRRLRGEHGGYIPRLFTPAEHDREVAWEALRKAAAALPFCCPPGLEPGAISAATVALRACQGPS